MIGLALATLLLVQDPVGDTFGDGSLQAPTAALYQSLAPFDVTRLELLDSPTLGFSLTLGSLANPLELPLGFSFPIIEIYISDDTPGSAELLPGSGMALSGESTWHYAVKLTGDGAQVFIADDGRIVEAPGTPSVSLLGTTITVQTTLPRAETISVQGVLGSYSPFSPSGWQALSPTPSPWAFSSSEQRYPVVDVIGAEGTQERALQSGVLPRLRRASVPDLPGFGRWLWLVSAGLLIALVGLIGRLLGPGQHAAFSRAQPKRRDAGQGRSGRENRAAPGAGAGPASPESGAVAEHAERSTTEDLSASDSKDTLTNDLLLSDEGWLEIEGDADALAHWEDDSKPGS